MTCNTVMFDPSVSDPLVIEHGPDDYHVAAALESIMQISIYEDIAAKCFSWSVVLLDGNFSQSVDQLQQGSHASWKVTESPGFFFFKIPGPGKSWKITLVLESPGN